MNILDKLLNIPAALAQGLNAGQVTGETESQLQGLFDFFVVKIPSFIAAFIVFILFWLLAKAIKGMVENRLAESMEENKEMQVLAGRTSSAVTVIIGTTVALNIAGIDLTLIIGAVGFGVGFALKDIIINFLAGVMILAQKQFTIGDFIEINGTVGKIIEIQSRATVLQALDGTMVVVPNEELFSKQVTSFTSNPFRRIEILVGVEYDTDLKLAVQSCLKAVRATGGILIEPQPAVLVDEFGDSSINLIVRAWVESRSPWVQERSEMAINIKAEFDAVGIGIPFPIRTVVFDKDVKEADEKKLQEQMVDPNWVKKEADKKEEAPLQQEPVPAPQSQATLQPVPVVADDSVPTPPVVKPTGETNPSNDQTGAQFLSGSGN